MESAQKISCRKLATNLDNTNSRNRGWQETVVAITLRNNFLILGEWGVKQTCLTNKAYGRTLKLLYTMHFSVFLNISKILK